MKILMKITIKLFADDITNQTTNCNGTRIFRPYVRKKREKVQQEQREGAVRLISR